MVSLLGMAPPSRSAFTTLYIDKKFPQKKGGYFKISWQSGRPRVYISDTVTNIVKELWNSYDEREQGRGLWKLLIRFNPMSWRQRCTSKPEILIMVVTLVTSTYSSKKRCCHAKWLDDNKIYSSPATRFPRGDFSIPQADPHDCDRSSNPLKQQQLK